MPQPEAIGSQPDTLRSVLRHVKRFGPRELVVTGGAGAAETEEVFRIAGLVVGAHLFGFELQAVRHLWEAGRLGVGETSARTMEFPALSLQQAYEALAAAAYGDRLSVTP